MNSKILYFIFLISFNSYAKLKVVTTTPDLAFIVKSIGQDRVEVESLLSGEEDPHFVDILPSFVAKVSKADVFCQVGLSLEIGWAPKVLQKAANSKVQKGSIGFCDASRGVTVLDKFHSKVDRSMGDVHSEGNPHYLMAPTTFLQSGAEVLSILILNDASNEVFFRSNFQALKEEVELIHKSLKEELKPFLNQQFLEYHKDFAYLSRDYGLQMVGQVEEVPGVPPSAGRLVKVAELIKAQKANLILSSEHHPENVLLKLKEMSGISYVMLPTSLKKLKSPQSFKEMQQEIVRKIKEQLK
jgi:zinc/manganese transport system substrate-binding protein